MELSTVFPPDAMAWLTRYGVFCAVLFFSAMIVVLALRPFWLWYTGRSEELDHLKRMEQSLHKSLLELELLNRTLSIPVKKAQQKAPVVDKAEAPMVVTQEAKDAFLKVLEKTRTRLQDGEKEE